jgi:hypothetical protein
MRMRKNITVFLVVAVVAALFFLTCGDSDSDSIITNSPS